MNVSNIMGNPTFSRVEQLYGVEIEVENGYNCGWTDNSDWNRVEDGSLRNDGMEFITPPATMRHVGAMSREFYEQYEDNNYVANVRTGIHVHADMRWRTLEQVASIVALYCVLEPLLFEMCGPDREECIYCVPWYRAPDDADLLREMRDMGEWRDVHYKLEQSCKYSALYLEPLRRLGTIEFRQAPTFESHRDLMRWVNAIDKLVTLGTYFGSVERVVKEAERDPTRMVEFVLPHLDVEYALNIIEECDSIGVAHRLVRTRKPVSWRHELGEELEQSGVYYQHAGGQRDPGLLRIEDDPFEEIREDGEWDEDYDEEDY